MSRCSLLAAAAALTITAGQAFASSPFSAIYSFGDSLSDVGNVYSFTHGREPAAPYVNGQFSNGPVWVQDLASLMGLPALTPSLTGGNDYAWGGATTGYRGTNNSPFPSLAKQISTFSLEHAFSAPSSALYTFSIGANDLFRILDAGLGDSPAARAEAARAAKFVAAGAASLEIEGAKDLVLFDVPDLGVTPGIRALGSTVSTEASGLSAYFDHQVLRDLKPVEAAGLKVFDLGTYARIDEVVNDPAAYGFINVTDPCWTGMYTGYANGGALCSTDPAVQDQYLFWDSVHPTEAGHRLIADIAAQMIGVAIPEPSTWAMTIFGFAGLALFGARRLRRPVFA
jgi:phospholipase/lecithinase/hemolysin